ncbi:hypothetical protein DRW03_15075 [Corallococcus sp. H22C18031201]|nr:hypothetical protein DRW03_15075 [Corallococcus sp. H22C18031201]
MPETSAAAASPPPTQLPESCPVHPERACIGTCKRCGVFLCVECRHPVESTRCHACVQVLQGNARPGLRGLMWLALLMLAGQPVLFFSVATTAQQAASGAGWRDIWANMDWLSATGYELLGSGVLALYGLILTPAYLMRRRWIPRQMQYFLVCNLVLRGVLVAVSRAMMLPPGQLETAVPNLMGSLLSGLLMTGVWMFYFAKSNDVKQTFVT